MGRNRSLLDVVVNLQNTAELTGLDPTKEIIILRPAVAVILCTGYSHLVDDDSARAAGIEGFAMKPLTNGGSRER